MNLNVEFIIEVGDFLAACRPEDFIEESGPVATLFVTLILIADQYQIDAWALLTVS